MKSLLVAFILLLSSPSSSSLPYSDLNNNATDQHSLLEFKAAITHDPHQSLANWNSTISFCGWKGVACSSRRQRVVGLNLSGMALEGSISPSLANLSFLRFLALDNNNLQAQIPSQLGLLSRLTDLRLQRNNLEGHIPASLSACRNLITLRLSNNFLTGSIPAEVGLLRRLKILALGQNNLTGSVPSSLGNLSALTELALYTNHLEGSIPQELGMLTNLSILHLYENQLTGVIPSTLGNLSGLTSLVLDTNHLGGAIPHELGMLTSLSLLAVVGNQLTGVIPSSLGNLSALTDLELGVNHLEGAIPQELGMLTNLTFLHLNGNRLTGIIPAEFGDNLLQLQYLHLWGNQLSGSIPISLSNCSKLIVLGLDLNRLSGVVPVELGKLPLLERLYLQNNMLVSSSTSNLPILTALTNCSSLEQIALGYNQLQGQMPVSMGHLSSRLTYLDLGNNYIGGSIALQVGNLTNLTYLDLSHNLFSGEIPSVFKRLKRLEILHLENNRLEGGIFYEIDQLERLGLLSISNNMISGKIPDSLCHIQQLRRIYFDHNQFSGGIPSSLGECQSLELLDMSHNKFSGSIPQEVAGLQNLAFYLNLSSNSLQGSLPAEISKIRMALAIDISVNQLSGIIPESLASCIALEYLNLSQNALRGQIPSSLSKLQNIQVLDFSSNFLSGAVPMSFKRLVMLRYINLSFNNLVGEISGKMFANSTTIALFEGNPGLCGLHIYSLPPCTRQSNHSFVKILTATIVSIGVSVLCCLILVFKFFKRRHMHRQRMNLSKVLSAIAKNLEHPRISYQELVTATNGFNEANLLGVGNFGSVYKGILGDGTIVAVKIFSPENEEVQRSFDRECRVLRTVRHKNIVRIITSCSNFDFKCLVMQFMANGSLEKHLYPNGDESGSRVNCGMSLRERLEIAIGIANGMSYLHHDCFVQVIHCDLKPSNILLDDSMRALVTDFGIARVIGENRTDSLISTLAFKGSMGYIAAEYGFGATASTNGDIYSFGIVLLEMLTRKRPTSDIFVDGLNLPKWVNMAFPDGILEVVDSSLLMHGNNDGIDEAKAFDCLVQLLDLGLLCANESPNGRPNMREIVEALERIKGTFFETQISYGLQANMSYLLNSQPMASQSSSTF